MEEIKNTEYYDKLDDKEKNRFHKLYLKYKKDEEKVIKIINYEKKMEKFGMLSVFFGVCGIYLVHDNINEFYFSGGLSNLEYLLFFTGIIPVGMGIYKYLYIAKEMNRKVSIAISIIVGYILGEIYIGIIEMLFNFFIINFMFE